ncbi:zinc finger protein 385D isoform X2 [Alosa sapidissima]|uniref:zinc finger protein 385D isoform X2 n=1 Tax=Alosa sapidissima TaxID=34773 RepID=UPI001C07FBE5|nr:zinc finger protein 385D isoform X2 [Alosa sapidissima]
MPCQCTSLSLGMKRPFSPTPAGNGDTPADSHVNGTASSSSDACERDPRPKRERKQRTLTLCEVCNIQLNSSAQAQIHYNGKTHQRRLRQASLGKGHAGGGAGAGGGGGSSSKNNTGSPAQGSPLLASLSLPGRPLQPQLDLKHFLPLRVNGTTPLSLFPNFNTMDPVQKAVINHTFGVPQPLKKKQIISCNICHLRFNSTNQAEAHYKGHKHARKLKALDNMKNKQRNHGAAGREREKEREREREREKEREREREPEEVKIETPQPLMDTTLAERTAVSEAQPGVCKLEEAQGSSLMLTPVSETSSLDAPAHLSPEVSPVSGQPESVTDSPPAPEPEHPEPPKSEGDPPSSVDEEKDPKKSSKQHLHCPVCKITVNSSSQLEAHYSGSKHKLMLEGQSVQPRRRGKLVSSRMATRTKRHGNKSCTPLASQSFHCDICDITVNSETQLKQHTSSRRHKDRLAGKPPKPKFSPYTKSQTNSVLALKHALHAQLQTTSFSHRASSVAVPNSVRWNGFSGVSGGALSTLGGLCHPCAITTISPQTKLALQKQLSKTLTASFLPSPLTQATLCTMATNPLTLRHAPGPATIIQTPLLSPALFRPAPGPLRATHAPIIFSPY